MTTPRSPITTHVLDTSCGRPAAGVPVCLERGESKRGPWRTLAEGETNADGRVANLLEPGSLEAGIYRIRFDTATYFERGENPDYFYPYVEVVFMIETLDQHYHVPLLLNPFGYSTYRGS